MYFDKNIIIDHDVYNDKKDNLFIDLFDNIKKGRSGN